MIFITAVSFSLFALICCFATLSNFIDCLVMKSKLQYLHRSGLNQETLRAVFPEDKHPRQDESNENVSGSITVLSTVTSSPSRSRSLSASLRSSETEEERGRRRRKHCRTRCCVSLCHLVVKDSKKFQEQIDL